MTSVVQTGGLAPGAESDDRRRVLSAATTEVFEIMLGSNLVEASDPGSPAQCDFTSMVGLAGNLCGVLSLHCASKTATLIASKMLGLSVDEAQTEQWDAAGEVCNMIAGSFKAKLPGLDDQCLLSVPTVITGTDFRLYSLADGGRLEIPFEFEGSVIWVSLQVHS